MAEQLRIGEILIQRGLLTQERLESSLKEQALTGKFLGEILISNGYLKESQLLTALAEQFLTRFVSIANTRINPLAVNMVSHDLAWEYKIMPIEIRSGILLIAVSNPLDMWPMSVLRDRLGLDEVRFVLAEKADILSALKKYYGDGSHMGNAG